MTVKRLALSRTLLVSARLPRSYEGSKLRFVYVSKTDDYIGSSRAFNVRVGEARLGHIGRRRHDERRRERRPRRKRRRRPHRRRDGSGGSCAGPDC